MPLPELIRRNAQKLLSEFCDRPIPAPEGEEARLRFTLEEEGAVLCEERRLAPLDVWTTRPLARFVYNPELAQWTLHYVGPSGRWHFYLNAAPSLDLAKLLRHVESDPFGHFRGENTPT